MVNILFRVGLGRASSARLESGDFLAFSGNRDGSSRRGRRGVYNGVPVWRRRLRRIADYFAAASLMLMVAIGAAWFARLGEQEVRGAFRVLDGDSLELGAQRYRLQGIDAPEYSQTCRRNGAIWPCGREAAQQLRRFVRQGGIACSGGEIDKFDRLLVVCRKGGTDINRQMVLEGWAVSFGDYEAEERLARQNGSGIWASEFDRPRDWRELHGRAEEADPGGSSAAGLASSLVNRGRLWLRSVTNWFGE